MIINHLLNGIFFYLIFTYFFHLKLYNFDLNECSISSCEINYINRLFLLILFLLIFIFINIFCIYEKFVYFPILFNIILIIFGIMFCINKDIDIKNEEFKKTDYLYLLITPDFYFAKLNKVSFEHNVNNFESILNYVKAKHITCWNNMNFYISIFFYLLCFFYYFFFKVSIYDCVFSFLGFILFRTTSRSIEIIIAFYTDITDSKLKNPDLDSNARIALATKSYVEIIFNFATLNFLGSFIYKSVNLKCEYLKYCFEILENNTQQVILNLKDLNFLLNTKIDIIDNPIKILIKSFGITTFTNASVNSISGILQILTTLVLVLFALAGYLNNKGDNK